MPVVRSNKDMFWLSSENTTVFPSGEAAEKEAAEKAAAAEPVEEVTDESDGGEEIAEKPEAGETPEASSDDPPAEPEQPAGEKQADAQGSVDGDDTKAEG